MKNKRPLGGIHSRVIQLGLLTLLMGAVMSLNGCLVGCSHSSWGSKYGWKCHRWGSGTGQNPRGPSSLMLACPDASNGSCLSPTDSGLRPPLR